MAKRKPKRTNRLFPKLGHGKRRQPVRHDHESVNVGTRYHAIRFLRKDGTEYYGQESD